MTFIKLRRTSPEAYRGDRERRRGRGPEGRGRDDERGLRGVPKGMSDGSLEGTATVDGKDRVKYPPGSVGDPCIIIITVYTSNAVIVIIIWRKKASVDA